MDRKTTPFNLNSNFLVIEINEYLTKLEDYFTENHFSMYNQFMILSGKTGSIIIDDKTFSISDYSLITLMKNQSHCLDNLSEINGYNLLFNENRLFEEKSELYSSLKLSLFECILKPAPIVLSENDFKIFTEIFEILRTDLTKGYGSLINDIHENLLFILLQKVLKLKAESGIDLDDRDRVLLKDFNHMLNSSLKNSRSVKYYADFLAVSSKKLNSITKTYLDLTAKEFIEKKIISESKHLLINSSGTIKEISYTMGFTEPTNFNKFFRKHTSQTPQQFRKFQNKGLF